MLSFEQVLRTDPWKVSCRAPKAGPRANGLTPRQRGKERVCREAATAAGHNGGGEFPGPLQNRLVITRLKKSWNALPEMGMGIVIPTVGNPVGLDCHTKMLGMGILVCRHIMKKHSLKWDPAIREKPLKIGRCWEMVFFLWGGAKGIFSEVFVLGRVFIFFIQLGNDFVDSTRLTVQKPGYPGIPADQLAMETMRMSVLPLAHRLALVNLICLSMFFLEQQLIARACSGT